MSIFYRLKFCINTLLVLFVLQSCSIDDDRTECPDGVYVTFKYKYANQQTNDLFDQLDLLVFDDNNILVDYYTEYDVPVNGTYYKKMNLLPGNYTLVIWGGLADKSFIVKPELMIGETDLETPRLILKDRGEDNKIIYKPHTLIHGIVEGVKIGLKKNQDITIPMVKDNNIIHVDVRRSGVPVTKGIRNISSLELNISDNNGTYRFDNSVDGTDNYLLYTPFYLTKEVNRVVADFHTLKLEKDGRNPSISITDFSTGKKVLNENLVELILHVNDLYGKVIDLERDDYFDIIIELDDSNAIVSITVKGWVIVRHGEAIE